MAVGQYGGMAAAFALGGALLAVRSSTANEWRWVVLCMTGPLVAVTLLMLVMREPSRTEVAIKNPPLRIIWPELWQYRAVIVPLLSGIVMAEIAGIAVLVWAPPALSRIFALTPERTGAVMATALLISGILGPIAGGVLADVCQRIGGPRRTIAVLSGLGLLSIPAGLFAIAPSARLSSILLVAFITTVGAIATAGTALFSIVIPNELRGLSMSILVAVCAVFGAGLAPLMVSLLSGAMGGPPMIGRALALVAAVSSAVGALMFASGIRCFSREFNDTPSG
jgi:MFS family permease